MNMIEEEVMGVFAADLLIQPVILLSYCSFFYCPEPPHSPATHTCDFQAKMQFTHSTATHMWILNRCFTTFLHIGHFTTPTGIWAWRTGTTTSAHQRHMTMCPHGSRAVSASCW